MHAIKPGARKHTAHHREKGCRSARRVFERPPTPAQDAHKYSGKRNRGNVSGEAACKRTRRRAAHVGELACMRRRGSRMQASSPTCAARGARMQANSPTCKTACLANSPVSSVPVFLVFRFLEYPGRVSGRLGWVLGRYGTSDCCRRLTDGVLLAGVLGLGLL